MDMGMNIQVRLYASLRKWSAEPLVALELPAGSTVREAIIAAGVPEHEAAIIMRNGRRGTLEEILADGDDIQLFPAIGGG
jgi:sulfur-carrier protein